MKSTVSLVVFVVLFGSSAFAGSGLSDSWDLGDINASYGTNTYSYVDSGTGLTKNYTTMFANLGGTHEIDGAYVSFNPNYIYSIDPVTNKLNRTQQGYVISELVWGEISSPLTTADICNLSQSNSFNARGIDLSENSWMSVYQNDNSLYANAGLNITLGNFNVNYAQGNYNEYTYGGLGAGMAGAGGTTDMTYYNWSVSWHGDFAPGTLPSGMIAPSSTSSVPEPGTFALAFIGLSSVGFVAYRRRKNRS